MTKQPVIDPDTNQPVMEEVVAAKQSLDLSPLKQRGPLHTIPDVPPGGEGGEKQRELEQRYFKGKG